jgi:uncharacterized protein (TIGR01440 family)
MDFAKVLAQAAACTKTLLDAAQLEPGEIVVVGCSTSEVIGKRIGTEYSPQAGEAIYNGIYPLLQEAKVHMAAQCCEHLNRALVVEKATARQFGLEIVSVVPFHHAGGSWATHVYAQFKEPVVVENLNPHLAAAGIDIGETCIGMHLRPVAVMVRPEEPWIGEARVTMVRTRPKLIGGERARYK